MLSARARRLPPGPVVLVAVLAAGIDNFVVPPMLLAIGEDLDSSLGAVAGVVAAYTFAYGLLQLAWGYASGRWGRLATIRIGLAAGGVLTLASAFASDLTLLLVLRGLAGAAFAAVVPAAVTYIGDHVPIERRARTLSDLVAFYAGGIAAGIVLGGVASDIASWRVGLIASGCLTLVALVLQLRYERDQPAACRSFVAFAASVRRTAVATWPRAVALLGMLEGAALFGFLTFFPSALEDEGLSRRLAGLVVALYGVTTVLVSRPAQRLAGRWPRGHSLAFGMLLGAAALALAAASRSPAAIAAAAVLMAAGLSVAHPLLQSWATAVMPLERATAVGLFVTGVFAGTALTTQLVAPLVTRIGFGWTFAIGAVLAAVLAGALVLAWGAYERATSPDRRVVVSGSE